MLAYPKLTPSFVICAIALLIVAAPARAIPWPQEITADEGTIVIYQPQPESLQGNVLKGRSAMSLELKGRRRGAVRRVLVRSAHRNRRRCRHGTDPRRQGDAGALAGFPRCRRAAVYRDRRKRRAAKRLRHLDGAAVGQPRFGGRGAEEPGVAQKRSARDRFSAAACRAPDVRRLRRATRTSMAVTTSASSTRRSPSSNASGATTISCPAANSGTRRRSRWGRGRRRRRHPAISYQC